jgi:protein-disulfide isomerase
MKTLVLATTAALGLLYTDVSFSQNSKELHELKQDVRALKAGQLGLQRDLQMIKQMLETKQAPIAPPQAMGPPLDNPVVISLEGGATKGNKNAKVTLVEFTDYQCPFCSRHFRDTMPQIDNDYVKSGKIRYVLRDFPLESIHPLALKAAEAANCSGDQGKYWEMHDRLFAMQNTLAPQQLSDHADILRLDTGKFKTCLESGKYTAKVRQDVTDAQKAGITGTPTFFVGLTDPKGSEIKAVKKIVGAQNYAAFKAVIDALLDSK